jgi:hypothetical protein
VSLSNACSANRTSTGMPMVTESGSQSTIFVAKTLLLGQFDDRDGIRRRHLRVERMVVGRLSTYPAATFARSTCRRHCWWLPRRRAEALGVAEERRL